MTKRRIPTEKPDGQKRVPGSAPGTIIVDAEAEPSRITVFAYDAEKLCEETGVSVERVAELGRLWSTLWVNVTGLGDGAVLEQLAELFDLHPLVLEDVLHVTQRPKVEEYDDYNFIVMRMTVGEPSPETEQLAIVQKSCCVITFQQWPGDCLEPVRDRLRRNVGRIRRGKADYLAYSIIDAIIDHYEPLLDWYGDRIETIEHHVVLRPVPEMLAAAYDLKHELHNLRRMLVPMRDAVGRLHREEVPLLSDEISPYLRDCYDHLLRLIETLELHREAALGLMELYMSSVSQRMNEVMKVLTIIATIFIPLSFIVGLYGMNFDRSVSWMNMPELGWRWGYPFALALMLGMTGGMLIYFRRKGWLSNGDISGILAARDHD